MVMIGYQFYEHAVEDVVDDVSTKFDDVVFTNFMGNMIIFISFISM